MTHDNKNRVMTLRLFSEPSGACAAEIRHVGPDGVAHPEPLRIAEMNDRLRSGIPGMDALFEQFAVDALALVVKYMGGEVVHMSEENPDSTEEEIAKRLLKRRG